MDRKYLKYWLMAFYSLIGLAVLSIALYLILPQNSDFSSWADSARAFLGMFTMLLIILIGIASIALKIVFTIHIIQRKDLSSNRQILWVLLNWLVLDFIGVTIYYFIEKEKSPGNADPLQSGKKTAK